NVANVIEPPTDIARIQAGTAMYKGAYLQLAQQSLVRSTAQQADGQIMFGNLSVVTGHESVTRYSGIGFAKFTNALCMDYKGVVCKDALSKAFQPLPGTDIRLIDALRVQTLVLQNSLYPDPVVPSGWTMVHKDEVRTVWTRDAPLSYPGRVSW